VLVNIVKKCKVGSKMDGRVKRKEGRCGLMMDKGGTDTGLVPGDPFIAGKGILLNPVI
jgi:hypothetical protein